MVRQFLCPIPFEQGASIRCLSQDKGRTCQHHSYKKHLDTLDSALARGLALRLGYLVFEITKASHSSPEQKLSVVLRASM